MHVFNYDDDYEKEDNGAADDSDEWKLWNIFFWVKGIIPRKEGKKGNREGGREE